jgi:hypothetical protein
MQRIEFFTCGYNAAREQTGSQELVQLNTPGSLKLYESC